jgi:F0F1-type ATP synthase membrane subunit b/b'
MSDTDQTLRQLLEVEQEAASIVAAAQKKADEMVAEADRKARSMYDGRYQEAVAALSEERKTALGKIAAVYDEDLARYRSELDSRTLRADVFNKIARDVFLVSV